MSKKKKIKRPHKPTKVKQPKQPITLPTTENSQQTTESSAAPLVTQCNVTGERRVSNLGHPPKSSLGKTKTTPTPDQPPRSSSETAATADSTGSVGKQLKIPVSPQSRMRRMLPDLLRVFLALSVIAIGIAIWFQPPIFKASFPHTTFQHRGKSARDATLYRPAAMPERYYIELPEKLENRYQWFAVDRRREVVAACEEPLHSFLGKKAIRRGAPLGLDLEFRKLDGSEWLIHFYIDAIVFSNNVLAVRLDIKK